MDAVTSRIRAKASVVAAELDDQMVLLDVDSGVYYGIDTVGRSIWLLASHGAAEEEMVASLLDEYEVDSDQLRSDLSAFLANLREHGLIYTEP